MDRQPRDIQADFSKEQHFRRLGRRMIRETEAFLNYRIDGTNLVWPADKATQARLKPQIDSHDRRQQAAGGMMYVDIRTKPNLGTLVQIRPNPRGVVDDARLRSLEVELRDLTSDRTAGDIVIGMERVAVMTAGFMSLLAVIRPRLACQKRKLSLAGLRPECAMLLRGSELEELLVA